ncbi:unnamed protein product [Schistosoma intercalatum]|nr:unnamed protein product [Schistosoma intercalatum]CAH8576183.1 unnamed protein product [Schistosoma intercalatum]
MNTENKSKLTLSDCVCDICQCFNNKLENKQYTHVKCKLNDKVKLWNRYEGIVKFIGPIHFKSNVSVILVGIELDSHISRITLNNYNLYCDQMKRILVPTTFFTLLSPGQRGYPQIKGFKMNPNYKLIQKNRELYKTIDPILYQLRFRR